MTIDLATVPVDEDPDGILLREAVAQHAANTPMAGLWYSMPYRDSISHLTGNAFWDEVAIWRYVDAIRKAGIATYLRGNWKDEPTSDVLIAAHNLDSRLLVAPALTAFHHPTSTSQAKCGGSSTSRGSTTVSSGSHG